MIPLLTCNGVSKAFGAQTLFSNIDLVFHEDDRIGLIGPNGTGKSTFLRILAGLEDQDSGTVTPRKHTSVVYLPQTDVFNEDHTPVEALETALAPLNLEDTERRQRIMCMLSRAEFTDTDVPIHLLSGGWRKRLAISRALTQHPDLLIMDEPTNHLDMEGILWLEKLLSSRIPGSPSALLMVSHDRRFLENTVNRIVELSPAYPGYVFAVTGTYSDFLEKKSTFLVQQQQVEERMANKMRRETEWLRRGPKARGTKAKYRIDEAGRLEDSLGEVRARNRAFQVMDIGFDNSGRKTKKLLEARGLCKSFDGTPLFSDLNLLLTPGSRVGLLGRNGCGKSTLMKILAASEGGTRADSGTIRLADKVRIVSFDQRREQLNPAATLHRALAPDGDSVLFRGRSLHVVSWAKRFLFRPDQLETPVGRLSGGEQARILIARLMLRPADILLLDEPTNDLDIPSLDVLEEGLMDFPGALVLVTHDRFLLDRVCNHVLGFDHRGGIHALADYGQWLELLQHQENPSASTKVRKKSIPSASGKSGKPAAARPGKLSYLDQREYDAMEKQIQAKEERLEELEQLMALPETVSDADLLAAYWQETETLKPEIEALYCRWDELERLKEGEQ
ncbi:MAG: ABC transporter ATP-binding protein [Desulfobulbus propionicus]|nr:MAG: ABC transporter ATP-binding protein [Desulfobulbus propionicus]